MEDRAEIGPEELASCDAAEHDLTQDFRYVQVGPSVIVEREAIHRHRLPRLNVTVRDWRQVARRGLVSALALGSLLGAIGFCRIAGWSLLTDLYEALQNVTPADIYSGSQAVILARREWTKQRTLQGRKQENLHVPHHAAISRLCLFRKARNGLI